MRILVTGGCGYVGSVLVPKLLEAGHEVTVEDLMWFGRHLESHAQLTVRKWDFRDVHILRGDLDAVIHLAAVANDPSGDLNPKLTWETNALGSMRLADAAAKAGVKQFIYASSGSVYGVSDAPKVTEETPLVPISDYNKTKAVAERCVLSYSDQMAVQVIRPATVCGFSPRMRLDVVVNQLTMEACTKGKLVVKTPNAIRPHIHIEDMTYLYCWLLEHPELTGIYNAGFENQSVGTTAEAVRVLCNIEEPIEYAAESNDPRSYRLNSDKLLKAGFKPKHTVEDAIKDIANRFATGELVDKDECHNVRHLRNLLRV